MKRSEFLYVWALFGVITWPVFATFTFLYFTAGPLDKLDVGHYVDTKYGELLSRSEEQRLHDIELREAYVSAMESVDSALLNLETSAIICLVEEG